MTATTAIRQKPTSEAERMTLDFLRRASRYVLLFLKNKIKIKNKMENAKLQVKSKCKGWFHIFNSQFVFIRTVKKPQRERNRGQKTTRNSALAN